MSSLVSFAVFAVFSLNLLLQCGAGIQDYAEGDAGHPDAGQFLPVALQAFARFFTVLLFWRFFTWIFPSPNGAFLEYFLAFPLLFAAGKGMERLSSRFPGENSGGKKLFLPGATFLDQSFIALVFTLRFASGFGQALVLSLAFFSGNLLAFFILRAIRRRASLERVPRFLRGIPLVFLSAGLLALIFTSLEGLFYRVLFP